MNPRKQSIRDWLFMADIDLKSAKASFKDEIYSSVCFHAQQAVEKSFKAFLLNFSKEVIKTHDLLFLFSKVLKYEKSLKKFKNRLSF